MQSLTFRQKLGVQLIRAVSAAAFAVMALRKLHIKVDKREFRYGAKPAERLDYLRPAETSAKTTEAIVYMHGGGWIACNKRYYPADLQFLCDAGYPVFNVEYPLAPEDPHPFMLHSILRAVAWIKREHPHIRQVHMMGDSAGANLAAMYCVLYCNPRFLETLGGGHTRDDLIAPASLISVYGLMDRQSLIGDNPEAVKPVVRLFLQSYGGPAVVTPAAVPDEQAITPMDLDWQEHPPSFLGGGDIDFLRESSNIYARELEQRGVYVQRIEYPNAPHGFFNMHHAQTPALKHDVLAFLSGQSAVA